MRGPRTRTSLRAALATACFALLAAAPADAYVGERVTIAVFGDSVAEGYTVPGPERQSLVPQVADTLVERGYERGGAGLIPLVPMRWSLGDWVPQTVRSRDPSAWRLVGLGGLPAFDGPSGYSGVSRAPAARASAPVADTEVVLLFTTSEEHTVFTVTAGTRVWEIDAMAPGPPRPAQLRLELPADASLLTVRGPRAGELTLSGAVGRRAPSPGRVQVEVSNLAHAGRYPQFDNSPRVLRAIADQGYGVTVFLWSYNSELATGIRPRPDDAAALYEIALLRRARLARASGGLCLIADSTPMPIPAAVRARFAAIHRRVASQARCTHTSVLSRLWSDPASSHRRGITQSDRVHPTPATYRRMARALAPVLDRLVRQHSALL